MKSHVTFSLIVICVFALSGTMFAQTEKPVEAAQPDAHHPEQQATSAPAETRLSDLPAQLEQMAHTLAREHVTPDMLKQMADRMKQMADQMKQMPGMPESAQKMPMMMDCQKMMPMMQKMMENMSGMMGMQPKMTPDKPMMEMGMQSKMTPDKPMMEMDPLMQMMSMMPMMATKHDPKVMSQMMQMRGEMMTAMGDIMLKYGKLMAEDATPAASIEQSMNTATYAVTLEIGPLETMLTPEEAKTAKEGEIMTSGEMSMDMPDMPLTHHLEVSVKDLMSGAVVTDQAVTITVTNEATKQVINVPVATMYGPDKGVADTHFGNNAALPPGEYTVVVTVGKETATFHVILPVS